MITFNSHSSPQSGPYYPRLIDEQIEAQRDGVTNSKSQSKETSWILFISLYSNPEEICSSVLESRKLCLISYKITKV